MKKLFLLCCLSINVTIYAQSPYIDRVYDYCPAPGQFINTMPKYEDGDTYASMVQKAHEALADNKRSMICLGGFGGSVTFGFDHDIVNVEGEYDFKILGNAFTSVYPDGRVGGSAEPAIVLVAADDNANGLPDDQWYEIAGSEYHNPLTKHNYQITYYRTPANHVATPSVTTKVVTDTTYIRWTDSGHIEGYITQNSYHQQDYYPQWIESDSISIEGTRLPNNAEWIDGQFVLFCYDYGYADNQSNNSEQSSIDIDWAVDSLGNPANLKNIRFVKVYTGVNQQCGWIGETSTEIMGAEDLHFVSSINGVSENEEMIKSIYDLNGYQINSLQLNNLYHGVYIVKYNNNSIRKIIK